MISGVIFLAVLWGLLGLVFGFQKVTDILSVSIVVLGVASLIYYGFTLQ